MPARDAKRTGRRKKRRGWLERVGLVALAALLLFRHPGGQGVLGAALPPLRLLAARWRPPPGIHVIDVGKADAILLRCEGKTALLDAGTYRRGDRWWTTSAGWAWKALDYVIASHPDSDHIGGMAQVLEEIPWGSAWSSIPGPRKCARLRIPRWRKRPSSHGGLCEVGPETAFPLGDGLGGAGPAGGI